jgi:hypothetical protein
MRREIVQHLLDCENVSAPRNERGEVTKNFTEQDTARLHDAQKKLREFGTQMIAFVQTDAVATNLIRQLWRYDPTKASQSLMGLSYDLAVYGPERARHRKNILDALRIKASP